MFCSSSYREQPTTRLAGFDCRVLSILGAKPLCLAALLVRDRSVREARCTHADSVLPTVPRPQDLADQVQDLQGLRCELEHFHVLR